MRPEAGATAVPQRHALLGYRAGVLRMSLAATSFASVLASALAAQQGAWSVVPGDPAPPRWTAGLMAFDRARSCTVLVNGSDVWEARGTAWRFAASVPNTGGFGGAFAYDGNRQRCLWFGGFIFYSNQLIEWDGAGWHTITTAHAPSPRADTAMAYDWQRARLVLYGGWTGAGYPNDTWEFDGADWSQVSPTASPPGMSRHRMTYDLARGEIVLYSQQNGLWLYDGTTWRAGPPGPPALISPALVYDEARARTVLTASSTYTAPQSSTWEWDGSVWTNPQPAGPTIGFTVNGAYDSVRGIVQLAASTGDGVATWAWNGAQWQRGTPFGSLPATPGHAIAYHAPSGRAVVFGGGTNQLGATSGYRDTYAFGRGGWSLLAPATMPPARSHAAMAAESNGDLLLMGGQLNGTAYADSWRWNGVDWAPVVAPVMPPARSHHAMATDLARGRIVMFGGQTPLGSLFGDTWEWDGATWTQMASGGPTPRVFASMAYDPLRAHTLLFGGGLPTSFTNELWQWDGVTWSQRALAVRPAVRGGSTFTFDPRGGRAVLAGGFDYHILGVYVAVNETWLWDDVQWTQVVAPSQVYDVNAVGFYDDVLEGTVYSTTMPLTSPTFARDSLFAFGSLAAATTFGVGCPGTTGTPLLSAVGVPRAGNPRFAIWLCNARERSLAFVGFDWRTTTIPLGNGCQALLPGPVFATTVTDAFGNALVPFPLPADPALHGLALYGQGVTLDPAGALFGAAAMTAGLRIVLSN